MSLPVVETLGPKRNNQVRNNRTVMYGTDAKTLSPRSAFVEPLFDALKHLGSEALGRQSTLHRCSWPCAMPATYCRV